MELLYCHRIKEAMSASQNKGHAAMDQKESEVSSRRKRVMFLIFSWS